MPTLPLKPCSYPGCGNLVQHGRCELHREQAGSFVRDPQRQRLYDRAWQRTRRLHLSSNPWCADCLAEGIYTEATDVHHEERHEGDRVKFLTSPLTSLCKAHHSRRTAAEVMGEGGEKVSSWGASSARGLPHEKNSQCGESS